jgi:hypothetical protein
MDSQPSICYAALDTVPDPICVATSTGSYPHFNDAWIRRVPGRASPFNTSGLLQSVHTDDAGLLNLISGDKVVSTTRLVGPTVSTLAPSV